MMSEPKRIHIVRLDSQAFLAKDIKTEEEAFAILVTLDSGDRGILTMPHDIAHEIMHGIMGDQILSPEEELNQGVGPIDVLEEQIQQIRDTTENGLRTALLMLVMKYPEETTEALDKVREAKERVEGAKE